MGKFNEMMIQAEDALRAVRDLIETLPELEDEGGVVQELLSTGDGGFLVMYETDLGMYYFAYEDPQACVIEVSEYDLAKASSYDMTGEVPTLMANVNG